MNTFEQKICETVSKYVPYFQSNDLVNRRVDVLDTDVGCDVCGSKSSSCREKNAVNEYLPTLSGRRFSLELKGKIYSSCVRGCLDTWQ